LLKLQRKVDKKQISIMKLGFKLTEKARSEKERDLSELKTSFYLVCRCYF